VEKFGLYYDIFDDKVGKYEEKITFLKRYGYKCADYIPKKEREEKWRTVIKFCRGAAKPRPR